MRQAGNDGQALLELAVCLPAIILLVVYAHVACRTAHLRSAAASAARSELLHAGRRLGSLGDPLKESIAPGGRGISLRYEPGRSSPSKPFWEIPIPGMTGRGSATVEIEKDWNEIRPAGDIPRLLISRRSEMSIDCWDGGSSSGKRLKTTTRTIAALGFLR